MNEIIIELECATVTIKVDCCEGYRLLEDGGIRLTEDDKNRIINAYK